MLDRIFSRIPYRPLVGYPGKEVFFARGLGPILYFRRAWNTCNSIFFVACSMKKILRCTSGYLGVSAKKACAGKCRAPPAHIYPQSRSCQVHNVPHQTPPAEPAAASCVRKVEGHLKTALPCLGIRLLVPYGQHFIFNLKTMVYEPTREGKPSNRTEPLVTQGRKRESRRRSPAHYIELQLYLLCLNLCLTGGKSTCPRVITSSAKTL